MLQNLSGRTERTDNYLYGKSIKYPAYKDFIIKN